jgi:hypothetical protein
MDVVDVNVTAVDVSNQFVEIRSRRRAYRSIGKAVGKFLDKLQ